MRPGIDFKQMNDNLRKRLAIYDKEVRKLLDEALKQLTTQIKLTEIKPGEQFDFNKFPALRAKKDKLLKQLSKDIQSTIVYRQDTEWGNANKINDALVDQIANTVSIPKALLENAYARNTEALSAFQSRKVDGLSLSERVWNITGQFEKEMGMAIDTALLNGTPAAQLSREVRGLLNEPNKLFRRVRDARGILQLSKAAKDYHPGQGVYRSSYKNAMRLARTEITMAYRTADYTRYQQLDFITGFEVHLSDSHPQPDICDNLKGKYPKDFKFTGWHPQCLCYVTSILASAEELEKLEEAIINDTDPGAVEFKNKVTDVPPGMKAWATDNADRAKGWRNQPYFVKDNFVDGKVWGGLKPLGLSKPPTVITPPAKVVTKRVKTEAEKAKIQKAWNTRVNTKAHADTIKQVTLQLKQTPITSEALKDQLEIVKKQIKAGASPVSVNTFVDNLVSKAATKAAWDERVVINNLNTILADAKAAKAQYGITATTDVFNAVKIKLQQWEGLTLEAQQKKLLFEIDWLAQHKKYDTWQLAQSAYKKRLQAIEYTIAKNGIVNSIETQLNFALWVTKSTELEQWAKQFNILIAKPNAPIAEIKSLANRIKLKADALLKTKAKTAAKGKQTVKFSPGDYTTARKNAASWHLDKDKALAEYMPNTSQWWVKAKDMDKQAVFEYTGGSGAYNRPLRGYQGAWGTYNFKGIGNVPLNYENKEQFINALTKVINENSFAQDIWVQRGTDYDAIDALLGKRLVSIKDPQSIVGTIFTDAGFTSTSVHKGGGFIGDLTLNIYCPRGTKMIYAEPVSAYADNPYKYRWNGKQKITSAGWENEMILQRNTSFRITKVENKFGRFYIDVEVVAQ